MDTYKHYEIIAALSHSFKAQINNHTPITSIYTALTRNVPLIYKPQAPS